MLLIILSGRVRRRLYSKHRRSEIEEQEDLRSNTTGCGDKMRGAAEH